MLRAVRARLDARAAELSAQRRRLDEFEGGHRPGPAGIDGCLLRIDAGSVLDSATGGRP